MRVHEFGIGFPPRALSRSARDGDTTYTLNWLPIGGFVRLEGEEGESDDPRAFVRQGLATRVVILLAGVAMNLLLAFVIFSLIAAFADPIATVTHRLCPARLAQPRRSGLQGGQQTGTDDRGNPIYDETGDEIIAIDGQRFPVFDNFGTSDAPQGTYLRDPTRGSRSR